MIALLGETAGAPPPATGMGPDGSAGNQPRGTVIAGNFANRCGLFEKQSSFLFQAVSMETKVANNIFFHGPRAGMNFNDGFGGGNVVEKNLMFSTVMESGDHGPLNTWDRLPYGWELRADGTLNTDKKQYDEIVANFFVGNWYGQEAVDNDDGSAYFRTHHNFFAYAEIGMKNDFNGHSNIAHDNVYGYIGQGVGICGALPGHADRFFQNKVIQLSSGAYASWDCGCRGTGTCPDVHDNAVFTPDGQMGSVCGESLADRQKRGVDAGTTVSTYPSAAAVMLWARENLGMPPPS